MTQNRLILRQIVIYLFVIGMAVGFGWQADTAYARVSLTDLQNQINDLQGQVDALEGARNDDNRPDFQTQIDDIAINTELLNIICTNSPALCSDEVEVTFTTCGQSGHTRPAPGQCDAAYAGINGLDGAVTVTDGYQSWVVPQTGTYSIEAWGAQGGTQHYGIGGRGARMKGEFDLTGGQVLVIVVGQKGSDGSSFQVGGGGGTFVALNGDTPLIVAGGGGGAGNCSGYNLAQMDGKSAIGDGNGGSGGNNGTWCGCGGDGSPGGGFATDGTPSGGDAFLNGAVGDDTERPGQCVDSGLGGFGGGGNGGNGGGGGGGYEGGDGGGSISGTSPGKGGESFNTGANPEGEDGVLTGDGQVVIKLIL